jgi:hypothetical protein
MKSLHLLLHFLVQTEHLSVNRNSHNVKQFIENKENEELRDANTIEVQVTGKPNLFRPKLITSKYLMAMIVKSTVFPDLYDKELQDSYGVMTPEDLVYAMVDDAGEMQDFQLWMQKFQGFTKSLDEKVDEAKN